MTANICRQIIRRYKDGEPLGQDDFKCMLDILKCHQRADQKIGPGVKKIWVKTSSFRTRGFWLERIDGTQTDFSFLMCFRKSSYGEDLRGAARQAVAYQIISFKNKFTYGGPCPYSGITLTPENSDVHHDEKSFNEIFLSFFGDTRPKLLKGDGLLGAQLKDPAIRNDWRQYQFENAKLKIINRGVNRGNSFPAA